MELNDIQNKNTENFLKSYCLRRKMSEVSGYDDDISNDITGNIEMPKIKEYDKNLQAGQIRLLTNVKELTYVLLLNNWGEEAYVITAFSHYAEPATNEELLIDAEAGLFLNTLQIWNSRTLHKDILEKSWLVGEVSSEALKDAWIFWSSMLNGRDLPENLLSRIGTPITDDEDIRLEYMAECSENFADVDAEDMEYMEQPEKSVDFSEFSMPEWLQGKLSFPSLWSEKQTALAAGDKVDNIRKKCNIFGMDEKMFVEYSPEEGALYLEFYNKDWKPSAAFDQAEIIDENANVLGIVDNDFCKIKDIFAFDGKFGISAKDGIIYIPEEIEE